MSSHIHYLLKVAFCFGGLLSISSAVPIDERNFAPQDIITRDVFIIGGGATGTYSAVRLSQDMGESFVIVEKTHRLGGHTQTYIDPVTGFPVDYDVQAYHNISVVTNFFARFGVSLSAVPFTSPFATDYVDLTTEKVVPGYTPPDPALALEILAGQLELYQYLPGGYSLPDPVPADRLLPSGNFVTKYGIEAATPTGLKLIKAKKLLVTMPPILDNLGTFILDHHEESTFKQRQYTTYYTGIIRNGVPDDVTAMETAGTFPASAPVIEVISNHTPIQMRVPVDAVKAGFYNNLFALQGRHGTFWKGAAWAPDDSSLLWAFTEGILPLVVAALAS